MENGAGKQKTRSKVAGSSQSPTKEGSRPYVPAIGSSARKSLSVTPVHGGEEDLEQLGVSVRGRGRDSRPHTAGWEADIGQLTARGTGRGTGRGPQRMAVEGAAGPEPGRVAPPHLSLPPPHQAPTCGGRGHRPSGQRAPTSSSGSATTCGSKAQKRWGHWAWRGPCPPLPGPARQGWRGLLLVPSTRPSFQDELSAKRFEIPGRSLLGSASPYLTRT